MIELFEKAAPFIWHGLIILGTLFSFRNLSRSGRIHWLWLTLGGSLAEAGLLFRVYGPSYTIVGGRWVLSTDSSVLVYTAHQLPLIGLLLVVFALYRMN